MEEQFKPSELGTKEYWENIYKRDKEVYEETGDIGEIWFGESKFAQQLSWIENEIYDLDFDTSRILDIGCGNGHFLVAMRDLGYKQICGIDYSSTSVLLSREYCRKKEAEDIRIWEEDIINPSEDIREMQFGFIYDKGTYDAISLHEEGIQQREKYKKNVLSLLHTTGYFMITSCNWTKDELISQFGEELNVFDSIQYPTFEFGGKKGSPITTLIFRLK